MERTGSHPETPGGEVGPDALRVMLERVFIRLQDNTASLFCFAAGIDFKALRPPRPSAARLNATSALLGKTVDQDQNKQEQSMRHCTCHAPKPPQVVPL